MGLPNEELDRVAKHAALAHNWFYDTVTQLVTEHRDLRATILEYEHALEHVAETHDGMCVECQHVAQGALDGLNREMCLQLVVEDGIQSFRIPAD